MTDHQKQHKMDDLFRKIMAEMHRKPSLWERLQAHLLGIFLTIMIMIYLWYAINYFIRP